MRGGRRKQQPVEPTKRQPVVRIDTRRIDEALAHPEEHFRGSRARVSGWPRVLSIVFEYASGTANMNVTIPPRFIVPGNAEHPQLTCDLVSYACRSSAQLIGRLPTAATRQHSCGRARTTTAGVRGASSTTASRCGSLAAARGQLPTSCGSDSMCSQSEPPHLPSHMSEPFVITCPNTGPTLEDRYGDASLFVGRSGMCHS